MPGVEHEATNAGSQAPFHQPRLPHVVSQAPIKFLPNAIFLLEDHKNKKA